MRESVEFLGAEPENVDDEGVAVDHDAGGYDEHDYQLVPAEDNSFGVRRNVAICTCQDLNIVRPIVVQSDCRVLYSCNEISVRRTVI